MKTRDLSADELYVGMIILPVDHREQEVDPDNPITAIKSAVMMASVNPQNSMKGWPLEILAIDLPFIVVRTVGLPNGARISVDTRDWRLRECSREFAAALIENEGRQPGRVRRFWRALRRRLSRTDR